MAVAGKRDPRRVKSQRAKPSRDPAAAVEIAGSPLTRGPESAPPLSLLLRIAVVLLLFLTYRLYQEMPADFHVFNYHPEAGAIAAVITAAALFFGPLRARVMRVMERMRRPTPRMAWTIAAVCAVASGHYLCATARRQGTDFILYFHDEHSFMLQLRALATGRLWLPPVPQPLRDFVESFNMMVYPKYGSIYFPGTALLYTPFVAAGLPWWSGPLVITSLSIGLLYRLVSLMIDGVAGVLAVLIALGCAQLRVESHMLLSQPAIILFYILLMLAYLRWRRDRSLRSAAVIGLLAGWAGTTRPADALCLVLPLGIAMLLDLRGSTPRRIGRTVLALALAASPFLALQVWQNVAMTGSVSTFPSDDYVRQTYPAPMMGFHHIDWAHIPVPQLQEKRADNVFVNGEYARHTPANIWPEWRDNRLHFTILGVTSHLMLLFLLPLGFLGLIDRPRWILAIALLLFFAFYSTYVFYFVHYAVAVLPMMVVLTLVGAETFTRGVATRWRRSVEAIVAVAIATLCIAALPESNPQEHDPYRTPELTPIEQAMRDLPKGARAAVLFRFSPGCEAGEDPVYNTEAAWPEDNRILRCHDLGDARAPELFHYLAAHGQGDRIVYRYDRRLHTLSRLGTAAELSRH